MYVKSAYVVMVCLLEVLTFCLMVLTMVFCYGAHLIMSTSNVDGLQLFVRRSQVLSGTKEVALLVIVFVMV
jgi:hypothetical protein